MAEKKYPTHWYNKDGAVLTCENEKAEQEAKRKGYGPARVITYFPTTLYNKDGETLVVANEDDMKAAQKKGWGADIVVAPEVKPALPQQPVAGDTSTVRALLEEMHDMKNCIDELYDRLEAIEKTGKPAPAPKLPAAPKPAKAETATKEKATA